MPAEVNTTYNLEVMVENWNPTNTQNVTMILMHNPANITSLINKRLTLYFDFSPQKITLAMETAVRTQITLIIRITPLMTITIMSEIIKPTSTLIMMVFRT